jgi:hypothetical protein
MNTQTLRDPDFEALKNLTRLTWLVNFEAVATVPCQDEAIAKAPQ